jgi:hypothetical protein
MAIRFAALNERTDVKMFTVVYCFKILISIKTVDPNTLAYYEKLYGAPKRPKGLALRLQVFAIFGSIIYVVL